MSNCSFGAPLDDGWLLCELPLGRVKDLMSTISDEIRHTYYRYAPHHGHLNVMWGIVI